MQEFIKVVKKNLFLLNVELLGVKEAQLWIGPAPDGPLDDNNERVKKEREEAEKKKGELGWRISGIEAVSLTESGSYPGWYEVDTSEWIPDIYRFNPHGKANVQTPKGTELDPKVRDLQYSWPNYSNEDLENFPHEQQKFLYLERNKRGFCMRIEIGEKGEIKAAGDGPEWIPKWPEISQEVHDHYKKLKGK